LSRVPIYLFPSSVGADGKAYYTIRYEVAIVYLSAYTKYELIYKNVNYGAVTAEYV